MIWYKSGYAVTAFALFVSALTIIVCACLGLGDPSPILCAITIPAFVLLSVVFSSMAVAADVSRDKTVDAHDNTSCSCNMVSKDIIQ